MTNAIRWGRAVRRTALGLCLATATVHGQRTAAGAITARWIGQDRHDECGAVEAIKPNGYQDVHIAIAGLPRREIAAASITGHGRGEWQYRGVQNQYGCVLARKPGAATADLYFEPNEKETGREFALTLKFDDGTVTQVYFPGGKADPDLKVPELAIVARWAGQEAVDLTGPGTAVGPDGVVDAKIQLSKLSAKEKITSVLIEGPDGLRWMYGRNPRGESNAELVLDPKTPTAADLYFQPEHDLAGKSLRLRVAYGNGKGDLATVLAARINPKLAARHAPIPKLEPLALTARWDGQNAGGDVRVALAGLPANRRVAAAVLSDGVRGVWAYKADPAVKVDVQDEAAPLAFRAGANRTTADLAFGPIRNEKDATLGLRLVFADGAMGLATFPGGACDPILRAPALARNEAVARPGDDLAALVAQGGTVRLLKGAHALRRPLMLPKPIALIGEPGAVLVFSQAANDAPWSGALKVHAGGTTLRDFAIRFEGKVRFRPDVSWGAAVIASTDNTDNIPATPKVNVVLSGLTIDGPEASGPDPWEEAVHLVRFTGVTCGKVVRCIFRGGVVNLHDGPWLVEGNVSRGTPPKTFSHAMFAIHNPLEVVIRDNRVQPVGPSGKTWRFLALMKRGDHDVIQRNTIVGVGPRDDDAIPPINAPEIILTECYNLWFEGRPASLSADRRVLRLPRVDPVPGRTGDLVSILSGTGAGQWRRVLQRLEPTLYWLDAPLPVGADAVSLGPGFVNDVYEANFIEARGGSRAAGFVLAGNHFGTLVRKNSVSGAGSAFEINAYASETPSIFGWSRAPALGVSFAGNRIEDSPRGAILGVFHNDYSKTSKGRVYMTASLQGNQVVWSDAFLNRPGAAKTTAGITLGYAGSIDPGELVVEERDNVVVSSAARSGAPSALRVISATVNGKALTGKALSLTAARP